MSYIKYLEYLKLHPIYSGIFEDTDSVFNHFDKKPDTDIHILFANYDLEEWEGYAMVLYYRESTSKYYEVYGSHCSCYGLEGQWDTDEEVVVNEIFTRSSSLLKSLYEKHITIN